MPVEALASFAGVGHFLDLAEIGPDATVLDLGSGSGTDACIAAHLAGPGGSVVGVDMTAAQLAKARRHRAPPPAHVEFVEGLIEAPPVFSRKRRCRDRQRRDQPGAGQAGRVRRGGTGPCGPAAGSAFAVVASELAPCPSARGATPSCGRRASPGPIPLATCLEAVEAAGLRVQTVRTNVGYRFVSAGAQETAEQATA